MIVSAPYIQDSQIELMIMWSMNTSVYMFQVFPTLYSIHDHEFTWCIICHYYSLLINIPLYRGVTIDVHANNAGIIQISRIFYFFIMLYHGGSSDSQSCE